MAKHSAAKTAAKQNSEKKPETKNMLLKGIVFVSASCLVILAIFLFLKNSSYFKIERIEVIDKNHATGVDANDLLKLHKGRNIFYTDIAALASRIKNMYPTIENAVVKRVLPNKLVINIIPRVPIARLKSHGYFPIDRSGMVLSPEIRSGALPVIIGFSVWFRPRVGERIKNPQLENAFLLIDALQNVSTLSDYAVTEIDVSNHRNISFYLENGIEVKIGGEDFSNRLAMLASTLRTPNLDTANIKYIDLRFKDVVIGPK